MLADIRATVEALPGNAYEFSQPIQLRFNELISGVRSDVGIKVFGENLDEIERISIHLEGLLRQVAGTRSTFAERQTGREYVDIVPDRARHGLRLDRGHGQRIADVFEPKIHAQRLEAHSPVLGAPPSPSEPRIFVSASMLRRR